MKLSKGNLYIITAASGAGKTSLVKAVVNEHPNIKVSISFTTRPPRSGEIDGRDYFFIEANITEESMPDDNVKVTGTSDI